MTIRRPPSPLPATFAVILLTLAACRDSKPPSSRRPTTAPTAPDPRSILSGRAAWPGLPAPDAARGAPWTTAPVPAATAPAPQDAMASVPVVLRRAERVGAWRRQGPVRVEPAGDLAAVVRDERARRALATFRLARVCDALYHFGPSERGADDTATPPALDVVWFEAETSDDAFGVFSALAPPPRTNVADGSRVAEHTQRNGWRALFGWNGTVCVSVTLLAPDASDEIQAAARDLRAALLLDVPRADPPELLRAMPVDGRRPGCEWWMRSAEVLALPGAAGLKTPAPDVLGRLLGLDGRAALAITAYDAAPGEPPAILWAVRYADAEAAGAAEARYEAHLATSTASADRNTRLGGVFGRHLVGTWTADQESIANRLPRLRESLSP